MKEKEMRECFGESGLQQEDLEDFIVNPGAHADADAEQEIVTTVERQGYNPELSRDALFRKYYLMVSEGPGKDWSPSRRTAFALQTMNRVGVIDWPSKISSASSSEISKRPEDSESLESVAYDAPLRVEAPAEQDYTKELFGYRRLSRDEIKDNLIVVAGVAGLVLIAAAGVGVGVATGSPAVGAGIGATSVAAFCAVASRLASRWHTRFTRKYLLVRLLVCLTQLFSGTAWLSAKETWKAICSMTGEVIPAAPFGLCLFGLMTFTALASHIKLCRTDNPRTAKSLGWLEAQATVFALGALLFIAVNKP